MIKSSSRKLNSTKHRRNNVTLTFDPKTQSVHLCPKMHRWQKLGENPSMDTGDVVKHSLRRTDGRTDAQTEACKTFSLQHGRGLKSETYPSCLILRTARKHTTTTWHTHTVPTLQWKTSYLDVAVKDKLPQRCSERQVTSTLQWKTSR